MALSALAFVLNAQVEGDRGIPAVTASSDITVSGILVDVTGDNADDARAKGWKEAQKLAWAKAGGPTLSDDVLSGLVSAIVIEHEQISNGRYIARLGVIFDRVRASSYLGSDGQPTRSAPMLLIPITMSGGTQMVYEQRNAWQRAWAEYQSGASRVDYVRPSGAGGDSLLVNYGQTHRRSRSWWRNVLDVYEAADVLMAIADLRREYPGGPIKGTFTARFGPDNRFIASFTMTARNEGELPEMLARAVVQMNGVFEAALADGTITPDQSLNVDLASTSPELLNLLAAGKAAEDAAKLAADAAKKDKAETVDTAIEKPKEAPTTAAASGTYVVQFASPNAGAIDATIAAVRSTAGVRGAGTSSLAIGGTSVMQVTYAGSLSDLAAALRARGFSVSQGGGALVISR